MVKIYTNQNGQLFKVTCLSTDDKPIGVVPANTICEELDTGDKYFYDPVASQWVAYPGGSGGSGSGLPDPSTLSDGTALIKVGNEWKMQEGYGYTVAPAFEPIEWDGNTEGRESLLFDAAFKVTDDVIDSNDIVGATVDYISYGAPETIVITQDYILNTQDLGIDGVYAVGGNIGHNDILIYVFLENIDIEGIPISKGIYFTKTTDAGNDYVKSLTAPSTVHQFDPELIPIEVPIPDESSVGKTLIVKEQEDASTGNPIYKYELDRSPLIVNFYLGQNDKLLCDTPLQTLKSEFSNGRVIFGVLNAGVNYYDIIGPYTAKYIGYAYGLWEVGFERITCMYERFLEVHTIEYSDGEWTLTENSYTLTPAT